MNGTTILLLLTAGVVGGAELPRDLLQFGKMISCVQPGVGPLKYNNYGCWCGLGGSGTPVDEVDQCCQVHDKCYKTSRKIPGCSSLSDLPHILSYHYSCTNKEVKCSANNNKCQAAVCECDRAGANCFAQSTYNPDNKDLDRDQHCVN